MMYVNFQLLLQNGRADTSTGAQPQIYRLGLYNSFAGTPPELRFCTWACYHDRIHATIEDVLVELRGDYHGE